MGTIGKRLESPNITSSGGGKRVLGPLGVDGPPGGDVDLLAAVLVEGDAHPLQRLVAAPGTELPVHLRRGVEAAVTTQDPGLGLPEIKI